MRIGIGIGCGCLISCAALGRVSPVMRARLSHGGRWHCLLLLTSCCCTAGPDQLQAIVRGDAARPGGAYFQGHSRHFSPLPPPTVSVREARREGGRKLPNVWHWLQNARLLPVPGFRVLPYAFPISVQGVFVVTNGNTADTGKLNQFIRVVASENSPYLLTTDSTAGN